ncbi:MAG: hypothetical protein WBB28_01240 [Crinalium sp.]
MTSVLDVAESDHVFASQFIAWEASANGDAILVRRAYLDCVADIESGLLLSQIIYWNLPNKKGESKLTVERDGFKWLAKSRADWWDECRLTPRQVDRAIKILEDNALINCKIFKWQGVSTKHIRLNWQELFNAVNSASSTEVGFKRRDPVHGKKAKNVKKAAQALQNKNSSGLTNSESTLEEKSSILTEDSSKRSSEKAFNGLTNSKSRGNESKKAKTGANEEKKLNKANFCGLTNSESTLEEKPSITIENPVEPFRENRSGGLTNSESTKIDCEQLEKNSFESEKPKTLQSNDSSGSTNSESTNVISNVDSLLVNSGLTNSESTSIYTETTTETTKERPPLPPDGGKPDLVFFEEFLEGDAEAKSQTQLACKTQDSHLDQNPAQVEVIPSTKPRRGKLETGYRSPSDLYKKPAYRDNHYADSRFESQEEADDFLDALLTRCHFIQNTPKPYEEATRIVTEVRKGTLHPYLKEYRKGVPFGSSLQAEWEASPGVPYPAFVDYLKEKLAKPHDLPEAKTANVWNKFKWDKQAIAGLWDDFKRWIAQADEAAQKAAALGVYNTLPVELRQLPAPSKEECIEKLMRLTAIAKQSGYPEQPVIAPSEPIQTIADSKTTQALPEAEPTKLDKIKLLAVALKVKSVRKDRLKKIDAILKEMSLDERIEAFKYLHSVSEATEWVKANLANHQLEMVEGKIELMF